MQDNEQRYTGKRYLQEEELVKITNIKLKEKKNLQNSKTNHSIFQLEMYIKLKKLYKQ